MNTNKSVNIKNALGAAIRKLSKSPPDLESSLDTVQWINGLGTAYGSKVLRFLRPDICPVLDSRICEEAGYSNDRVGYGLYSHNAMKVAHLLEANSVLNPMQRSNGAWFAGDGEINHAPAAKSLHVGNKVIIRASGMMGFILDTSSSGSVVRYSDRNGVLHDSTLLNDFELQPAE